MRTLLVIDDDPLIAAIIQALDPHWQVLPAHDGLIGLDILRQRIAANHPPDLIVLDIHMPGFDGYDTCILIRALAPAVPIVPFTQAHDDARLPRYMHELHCTPPVIKGIDPLGLRQRLRDAMQGTPETSHAPSAVFDRLLEKAMEAEQQARSQRSSRIPVALFARSVVHHLGMQHVLETINDPPTAIVSLDDAADERVFATSRPPIVVAATTDVQSALAHCQDRQWPLLLLAHTLHDGVHVTKSIQDLRPAVVLGVVLADQTLMVHLPRALRSLAAGTRYAEPLLHAEHARRISSFIAEQRLLPDLSFRLIELVVLDYFGWTAAAVSAHFQVAPPTLETYWSRVAERLGRNREDVRVWVKHCVESQAILDRLRDYLESLERHG